jgi:hypothetical protein
MDLCGLAVTVCMFGPVTGPHDEKLQEADRVRCTRRTGQDYMYVRIGRPKLRLDLKLW